MLKNFTTKLDSVSVIDFNAEIQIYSNNFITNKDILISMKSVQYTEGEFKWALPIPYLLLTMYSV